MGASTVASMGASTAASAGESVVSAGTGSVARDFSGAARSSRQIGHTCPPRSMTVAQRGQQLLVVRVFERPMKSLSAGWPATFSGRFRAMCAGGAQGEGEAAAGTRGPQ